MIFKRKIYDRLLKWKRERNGQSALLVQGARRVGKSTIVEQFAKKEYQSYILIESAHRKSLIFSMIFLTLIICLCACS